MSHEKSPNTGPYVIYNGEISDAAIWEAEMDEELERKFDEYLYAKALYEAAEAELARRDNEPQSQEELDQEIIALTQSAPNK
jgi:membrane-bound lytic murein transglycosylase B